MQKRAQTASISRIKAPSQPLQAQFKPGESPKPQKTVVDKKKIDQLAKPKDLKPDLSKQDKPVVFAKSDKYLLQKFDREV